MSPASWYPVFVVMAILLTMFFLRAEEHTEALPEFLGSEPGLLPALNQLERQTVVKGRERWLIQCGTLGKKQTKRPSDPPLHTHTHKSNFGVPT